MPPLDMGWKFHQWGNVHVVFTHVCTQCDRLIDIKLVCMHVKERKGEVGKEEGRDGARGRDGKGGMRRAG